MKISRPAVARVPPRFGAPLSNQSGQGAWSRLVPRTDSQATAPVRRSTAVSTPQGGGLHGRPEAREQRPPAGAEGGPPHGEELVGVHRRGRVEGLEVLARDQGHDCGVAHLVDEEEPPFRVDRDPSPVRSTGVAGKLDRSLERGRREDSLVPVARELVATVAAIDRREAVGVLGIEPGRVERRGMGREGLGGRQLLARDVSGRNRALLDRVERLSRVAVEQEEVAHLGDLGDAGAARTHALDLEERRLGGHVVVPHVVVDGLEAPDRMPVGDGQGHDRARVVVEPLTHRGRQVGRRIAGRNEDQASLGIGREHRPTRWGVPAW